MMSCLWILTVLICILSFTNCGNEINPDLDNDPDQQTSAEAAAWFIYRPPLSLMVQSMKETSKEWRCFAPKKTGLFSIMHLKLPFTIHPGLIRQKARLIINIARTVRKESIVWT